MPQKDIVVRELDTLIKEMISNIKHENVKTKGIIYQEPIYKIDHDFLDTIMSSVPDLKEELLSKFHLFNPRQHLIFSCLMGLYRLMDLELGSHPVNTGLLFCLQKSAQDVCEAGINNYPISNAKVSLRLITFMG